MAGQRSKKTEENKHGAVFPGYSAKSKNTVLGLNIDV